MNRQEKVIEFFKRYSYFRPYWCHPGSMGCGCMGCVNVYPHKKEWYSMFPDEPYLTEDDILQLTASDESRNTSDDGNDL